MPKQLTQTFSQETIDAHARLAGDDREWTSATGDHKPSGSGAKKGLRKWLADRQGGICCLCGKSMTFTDGKGRVRSLAQINHVVSRGPSVRGFLAGNVFAGCAPCNMLCAYMYGEVDYDTERVIDGGVIPFTAFARPDLINMEPHPKGTFLKNYNNS